MPRIFPVIKQGGAAVVAGDVDQSADLGTDGQALGDLILELDANLGSWDEALALTSLDALLPVGADAVTLRAGAASGAQARSLGQDLQASPFKAAGALSRALGGHAHGGYQGRVTSIGTSKATQAVSRDGSANNPGDWQNPSRAVDGDTFSTAEVRGQQSGLNAPVQINDHLACFNFTGPTSHPAGFTFSKVELVVWHGWTTQRATGDLTSTCTFAIEMRHPSGNDYIISTINEGPNASLQARRYLLAQNEFPAGPRLGVNDPAVVFQATSAIAVLSGTTFSWFVGDVALDFTYTRTGLT